MRNRSATGDTVLFDPPPRDFRRLSAGQAAGVAQGDTDGIAAIPNHPQRLESFGIGGSRMPKDTWVARIDGGTNKTMNMGVSRTIH